jgi:hypothetical protein
LADRAGFQGAPRSPRIRFRQCDPPCSRSRAQPQQPNGVCRPGRPKAHEAGLPRSRHQWSPQLRMPVPSPNYMATLAAKKRAPVGQSPSSIRGAPSEASPPAPFCLGRRGRAIPVTAARSRSCEPDHRHLNRSNQCDLSTRSSPAEGNYARLKAISTESGGSIGAISSSVASVIFRLLARGDKSICGGNSLELAKRNAPTLPPARTRLSLSQLAAMRNPIECR